MSRLPIMLMYWALVALAMAMDKPISALFATSCGLLTLWLYRHHTKNYQFS